MEAWLTLATTDDYAFGALTMAASLKRVNTTRKVAIMITSTISDDLKVVLGELFDEVICVDVMNSDDSTNLRLLDRPELGITFTKIKCWCLTQYSKCVFLDADTLILQNCDELFDREELSAAPDVGWPDCFNSGVFVFRPSMSTYSELVNLATTNGSWDGGDQGLLNTFFSDWATKDLTKHLPFTYNMVASASYSYLPAYKQFGHLVKIVHFIGSGKPWLSTGTTNHHKLWWEIFNTCVRPSMGNNTGGLEGSHSVPCLAMSITHSLNLSPPEDSRDAWEAGTPDYGGTASFDNILEKINKTLNS